MCVYFVQVEMEVRGQAAFPGSLEVGGQRSVGASWRVTSGSLKGLGCGVRRAGSSQCSKGQSGILRAQEDEVKEKLIWGPRR